MLLYIILDKNIQVKLLFTWVYTKEKLNQTLRINNEISELLYKEEKPFCNVDTLIPKLKITEKKVPVFFSCFKFQTAHF